MGTSQAQHVGCAVVVIAIVVAAAAAAVVAAAAAVDHAAGVAVCCCDCSFCCSYCCIDKRSRLSLVIAGGQGLRAYVVRLEDRVPDLRDALAIT